jgi:hypothetical protein
MKNLDRLISRLVVLSRTRLILGAKELCFWYHTTSKENLKNIAKEGLKVNSSPNYSIASLEYMSDVYGRIPIFLAKSAKPYNGQPDSVVLKIDTKGWRYFLMFLRWLVTLELTSRKITSGLNQTIRELLNGAGVKTRYRLMTYFMVLLTLSPLRQRVHAL